MTASELISLLEDVDPDTPIKLALQPNYPMCGSIKNVCIEWKDSHCDEPKVLWIACSGNESYGCPREAWDESEIIPEEEDCK